jgi:hypothetical protein
MKIHKYSRSEDGYSLLIGSFTRLRPLYKDTVWIYELMISQTAGGDAFRILSILDQYNRECLVVLLEPYIITSQDGID